MVELPEYELKELLHNSSSSAVYLGRRKSDGLPVVIKHPQSSTVSARQLTRYRNEYEILSSLDSERVIKVHELLRPRGQLALVLEAFDGIALKQWIKQDAPDLVERLEAAIELTETLGEVHAAGIIHKDVNSHNVLIDPKTKRMRLIDFGIATRLRSEESKFQFPTALEGTLAYIAPEQTGRMNRSVDHRADWYSLGITLYELFTGALPHRSEDPLESVHFHIAGKARPITELDPHIPGPVADIVAKLLHKAPEDRYQSAAGIVADLRRCVDELESSGTVEPFDLGGDDLVDQFELPQKLYGRDTELTTLLESFDRVAGGAAETMLVSGGPGIGKTSLVREIYRSVTERRGYFVSGKYDQLRQDAPFSALVDALQDLVGQLLTESEESVRTWRDEITRAVGMNGQVVVDVIPTLELIVGPQTPVPSLPGTEAENRFKRVFKSFVQVFAKRSHPFVLFLDDMQWADSASLNLITMLLSDAAAESLLIVEAYRDGDTASTHSLLTAAKEQESQGVHVGTIALGPLDPEDIARLVADALHQEPASTKALAEVIHKKTGGNPFFLRQFLLSLHTEGLIALDADERAFRYDVAEINSAAITDNVAELLASKLAKLAAPTREALEHAAAIGRRFDLGTLAALRSCSEAEIAALLEPALDEELIVPISQLESLDHGRLDSPLGYRRLKFLHDRVQQAAYDLIEPSERPAIHLAIGRVRLGSGDDKQLDRRLFDIVIHMNQGVDLIDDEEERLRLAELNLRAGARARNSTAYPLAIRCFRHVLDLAGEDAWVDRAELALEAHFGLAECLGLTAEQATAFDIIDKAVGHCDSRTDLARLWALKVSTYLSMGQMPEALACGRQAIESLGIELPTDDAGIEAALNREIGAILERTAEIGVEKLIELPVMQEPAEIALMGLLTNCLPAAYQTNQQLFALMCCKMVSLSLTNGNCPLSARAYGSFAALLSSALRQYRDAHRFAKLAVDLAHRLGDPTVFSGAYFLLAMFASHWNEPVDESIELFKQSVDYGLQFGDHVHAAYSVARRVSHQQFRGMQLDELREEAVSALALLDSIGDLTNEEFLAPRIRFIDWLRGERPHGNTLAADGETEEQLTRTIRERGNKSFESDWFMQLARQRYLCGELGKALEFARESQELVPFSAAFVTQAEHNFYYSLIVSALHGEASEGERVELEALIDANQKELGQWAESAPANYRSMYLLVAAERERIRDEKLKAMQLYDDAIAEATSQGFAHIEALAAELAARFWHANDKPDFGNIYLAKALEAYEIWGAFGKSNDLRAEYGLRPRQEKAQSVTAGSTTMGGTTDHGDALDLVTALKASQAMAGEIVLDRLVAKMMGIVLESAGGEHAVLVIENDGRFLIQGVKDESSDARVMMSEPLTRTGALSKGIVNYVIRTAEHVVLADPALRGKFSNDPYVRERQPKSVLCAPIVHKGKLTGVIYLENNQIAGAFTPNRLEALNVLMSQIAVSIENATLYARQEHQAQSIELANTALAREIGERKATQRELSRYKDHLEELVAKRTRELESAQGRLVDLSRRAGMAEVAAGVLHNVGNVMNSVNVGAHIVRDAVKSLRVEKIGSVCDRLEANAGRLGEFLESDPQGRKVPEYLNKLGKALVEDKQSIGEELDRLLDHLDHMKRVIAAQQSYAKTNGISEVCTISEIVETALSIAEAALRNSAVEVEVDCDGLALALLDRHQILQILINLISNAKHAVQENEPANRKLRIGAGEKDGEFWIEVADNGVGISAENLPKVFHHGFTTKKTGHGFGLHNCANAAQEMGGSLEAFSDGPGAGAKFVLKIPVRSVENASLRSGAA